MQAAVVTFDHLAHAFLGCYGNTLIRTPRFDQFAAGSVVFDGCYAASSNGETAPGLPQFVQHLRERGGQVCVGECCGDEPLGQDARQMIADWQSAATAGRPALLWLKCSAVASPWSAAVERVLAIARDSMPADRLSSVLGLRDVAVPDHADSLAAALEAALKKLQADGLLARESIAPTREIGALRRLVYAAAVAALDDWLGDMFDLLEPRRSDTLVIIAAGQGDLAGPHAELAAGCPPLVEPLVHVPLLIQTGTAADGTRRGALTSTADIAATLAVWFGLEPDRPAHTARSLWPVLRDEAAGVREELLIGSPATGWCLRTADFACICGADVGKAAEGARPDAADQRPRLFVKPDDAWDTLDVAAQRPDMTAELVRRIRADVGETATAEQQVVPAADGP